MSLPVKFDPAEVLARRPWFEAAIEAVAPAWALRRDQARIERHLFAYNAAQADRIFKPKTNGVPAESSQTARDRVTMMWEARDLIENFPFARTITRTYSQGITPTEYAPNTGDMDYDRDLAEWFHAWCKRCDFTGRHSFRKLIQLAVEGRTADGDDGFALRRSAGEIKLQLISADRIGSPNLNTAENNYFSGVIVNDLGRPVAYRIYTVTKEGIYKDPEDISAANFIHYFDPFRCDQYRGITDFHAVIPTARMLSDILKAEMVGVKYSSQQAALIFNERGMATPRNLFQPGTTLPTNQEQNNEYSEIGVLRYLQRGDKVETMPARPSSAFAGFVEYLKNEIAVGMGYPSAVVFSTAEYSGPSVRAEFARADRVDSMHRGVLEDKVLGKIKDVVLLDAIARGEVPLPRRVQGEDVGRTLARALRGSWRWPAKRTIDVGRESDANINEHRAGLKSAQEIAGEQNADAFERIEQGAQIAAHTKKMAEKYEVPESAIRLLVNQLPSTPSAAAAIGSKTSEEAAEATAESAPGGNGRAERPIMSAIRRGRASPRIALSRLERN